MSQDIRPRNDAPGVDRLELHYRQQLSALVDGALAPDEARFLLRRLEHDRELAGSYERWQLYGQVMRGRLGRMAAPGFAEAVALAVREDAAAVAAPRLDALGRRRRGAGGLGRGGGPVHGPGPRSGRAAGGVRADRGQHAGTAGSAGSRRGGPGRPGCHSGGCAGDPPGRRR
ncbi:sigma-E factor negative regulatory protein, partial [Pseudoxanthomonas taiwanensis]|uniref:sigma-E factor negative regulatory protein n=1 Tax=Pseudoxanthomonas taiwanensis TaxID=176598 RepID=UPI0021C35878